MTLSEFLQKLSKELEISDALYDSVEKRYNSICEWLRRPESALAKYNIQVYLQGSFRLGTAIKPFDSDENYDLDIVCEVQGSKSLITQERFQELVGRELCKYAAAYGMERPERWDRCWTLNYSESARFHIDFLPSMPDGLEQMKLLKARGLNDVGYSATSIAITDKNHPNFSVLTTVWPASNPRGYARWFIEKMSRTRIVNQMRLAKSVVEAEELPSFPKHTPLQIAIRILKRHRDIRFIDSPKDKPSSIILTTLAARAYEGEDDILDVINGLLSRMASHIGTAAAGIYTIFNPTDTRENFADCWITDRHKAETFFDWLETAKTDFAGAANAKNIADLADILSPRLGRGLVEKILPVQKSHALTFRNASSVPLHIVDAPHRRPLKWPLNEKYRVRIFQAKFSQGLGYGEFKSGELVTPKSKLVFQASTDAQGTYDVFWQIVNTGCAATAKRNLRGNFEAGGFVSGSLQKEETAEFEGEHSIQCFIVQGNVCVARSTPFVVKIGYR